MTDRGGAQDDALLREVLALRAQVAELQRAAARHDDSAGISLAEREELLREAERLAHFGTWTWNIRAGRVTWSDEMYRILGLEPGCVEPSVEGFFAAVHPQDRQRTIATAEQAKQDGVLPLVDCRIVRPDGSIRHTTTSGTYLFDDQGNTRRMVGGVLDRTESLQTEAKLRRTLALLEEAQSSARLGSWRFDPETGETEWSAEFRRIAGLPSEIAPNVELFLERVLPEDRERFESRYRIELQRPGGGEIDGRVLRADGQVRHVRLQGALVMGTLGRQELRGTMLDITEQVRMREQLVHSQKMEAVGRLAGGIAHDFNNLLTVVIGNLELFADARGESEELDDCMRALDSAANLTRRLLAFGRKAQLSLELLSPNELVLSTLELLLRLVGDQVRLETDLAPELPYIHVDPIEFERALVNLVVNAKNVTPQGGVVWLRTRKGELAGKPAVEVSVADDGPGISEADRPHIFEPFYTTRGSSGGTGLGLATVLGTAEQHGGTVRVEHGHSGGAIFTIVIPQSGSEPLRGSARPNTASRAKEIAQRILVVDDEATVAQTIRRMLESRGHLVHVANGPEEAEQIFREHGNKIGLVICDVMMPRMTGPDLIRQLATLRQLPRVLFISGYNEEAVHALEHPFLSKPFSAAVLRAAVADALH